MNAHDLAKESDADRNASGKRKWLKVPITILILLQLVSALAAITVPLGYIALSSSIDITSDLTSNLIQLVAKESADGVLAMLSQVVLQTNIINSDPAIDSIVQYNYENFTAPQLNFSRTLAHNMKENPFFSIIRVTFHPNLTGTQVLPFTPGIGMARVSCDSAFVPSLGSLCYARLYQSNASGQVMYARAVNVTTGEDIGPQFVFVQKSVPTASSLQFYNFQLKPSFVVYYVNSTSFQGFALQFRQIYTPNVHDPYSGRMSINSLECLGTLESLFVSLLPSPNANMFLLDDLGLLVASTLSNTIAPNSSTRYAMADNPHPLIAAVGAFLAAAFPSASAAPNITADFSLAAPALCGRPHIVATKLVPMPATAQTFTLVLFIPRADFYSKSDAATQKSLAVSLAIAAAGTVLVGLMAYLGSVPLKKLAASMEKLTKFDFSVLESGSLSSSSSVLELYNVETSFLVMVKAFAQQIKRNKELSQIQSTQPAKKLS